MKSLRPLIIYGAGGHGRVVVDTLIESGMHVTCVVDDSKQVESLYGIPVTSRDQWIKPKVAWDFVVAVGNNSLRSKLSNQLMQEGGRAITVVHPHSFLSSRCKLDIGVVVLAGVIVNAGAIISRNVILNTGCSVDHDCFVGANSLLCPGVHLAGNVSIGENSLIGTGVSAVPGVEVGRGCEIGAGAVINKNIPDNSLAVGVPAKVIGESNI